MAQFVEVDAGLADMNRGAMEWGDYDNDGDLDLLSTGCSILNDDNDDCASGGFKTNLYQNNNGSFSLINTGIPGISSGNISWGDYDRDGDLDVLIVGRGDDFSPVGAIYRNNGGGSFSNINAGLAAVKFGTALWGDYDNDGDLDVFVAGRDGSDNRVAQLFRNNEGSFTEAASSIPATDISSGSWADYDKDGDLDLLLNGNAGGGRKTKLFKNQGDGSFSEVGDSFLDLEWASSDWGDYDNDGDLDLLLAGIASGGVRTRIYRNTNGVFVDIGAGLLDTGRGKSLWGDYDNDGLLDVLVAGLLDNGRVFRIYRNTGGGSFSLVEELKAVDHAAAAWGDFDGDGDLDIAMSGLAEEGAFSTLYRNDHALSANSRPITPTGLAVNLSVPGETTLSWNTSADAETPAAGLSYNLRIGTTPGGNQVMPAAATASGFRTISKIGNAGQRTSFTLPGQAQGTYYWSVQAVDHAFDGSVFSAEQSFSIVDGSPTVTAIPSVDVLEDASSFLIQLGNYFDDDEDGSNLDFTIESNSNAALITPLIANNTLSLSFTENRSGIGTVQIKGTDNAGQSVTASVEVTVAEVNDAPSFQRGDNLSVQQGAGPQVFSGWATNVIAGPEDEAGQQLQFMLETDNEALFEVLPELLIDGEFGHLQFTTVASDTGTAVVSVQLSDDAGSENGGIDISQPQLFTINIGIANSAPNVQLIDNIQAPAHQEPLLIRAMVDDLEQNLKEVSLNWVLDDIRQQELAMVLSGNDTYETQIPGNIGGSRIEFSIVAEDSLGLRDSTQVPHAFVVRPETPIVFLADITNEHVGLNWLPAVGAEYYNVYRGQDVPVLIAEGIVDTTFLDMNLGDVSFYIYHVAAVNEGGESGFSEDLTIPLCRPAAPPLTGIGGPERVHLSWTPVVGCMSSGFMLRRDGVFLDSLAFGATSFSDKSVVAGTVYEYDITALGIAGLDSEPGPSIQLVPFAYPQEVMIDSGAKDFGDHTLESSYRLVGLPGETATLLSSTFSGEAGVDWNAFWDNGSTSDIQEQYLVPYSGGLPEIFVFKPGKGFWVIQNKPWKVSKDVRAVSLNEDNTYDLPLQPGWNIISNPFTVAVEWEEVAALNKELEALWSFAGSFIERTALLPYEGYYYFNGRAPVKTHLKIPFPNGQVVMQSETTLRKNETIENARKGSDTRVLEISVTGPDKLQTSVQIGFVEGASRLLDAWDKFSPPGAFAGITLRLHNEAIETDYKWLASEFRESVDDGQQFMLALSVPKAKEPVKVEVVGLENFASHQVQLVDQKRAKFYNLKEQSFRWLPAEEGRYSLLIGSEGFVDEIRSSTVPDSYELSQNYPNPFRHLTKIEYAVPSGSDPVAVNLTVYNLLGQEIVTLVDREQPAGRYNVTWRPAVSSGVYLYKLTAGDFVETRTLVVVK